MLHQRGPGRPRVSQSRSVPPEIPMAPTTSPPEVRTGAAIPARPGARSSTESPQPRDRISASDRARSRGEPTVRRVYASSAPRATVSAATGS
nr:hypothetical protein GCM10020092_030360 [Actinoplanes digitatis]